MTDVHEALKAKEPAQDNNSSVQQITDMRLGISQPVSKQPELSETEPTPPTQSNVPVKPGTIRALQRRRILLIRLIRKKIVSIQAKWIF
ncbi:hypothetical protein [Desulfobacterium sp. N47]|uniref:Uncharacterized protein n=1 Tax=uncultured Desulfobacterium sp. TaxID=201089 RepID=E1YK84_9BACT|nr:unknown protein [uncultured Desulfobacterium sp.]